MLIGIPTLIWYIHLFSSYPTKFSQSSFGHLESSSAHLTLLSQGLSLILLVSLPEAIGLGHACMCISRLTVRFFFFSRFFRHIEKYKYFQCSRTSHHDESMPLLHICFHFACLPRVLAYIIRSSHRFQHLSPFHIHYS